MTTKKIYGPLNMTDTIDSLRAEKDRLATCLEKANINAEHFERESSAVSVNGGPLVSGVDAL